jgi:SAM-dependent methyltransferase
VDVSLLHGDMREVPRSAGTFDAVINMFTSFGYFEDEADNQRALDGVARALTPGGRFLIDTMNLTGLIRVFRPSDCTKRLDGSYTVEMRRFDVQRCRSEVEMLYFGPRRRAPRAVPLGSPVLLPGARGDAVEGGAACRTRLGRLRRQRPRDGQSAHDRPRAPGAVRLI